MANIDTLVQELGQLTVLEALELSKKLSKEWNIDLDNMMSAPGFDPARKMQVLKLVKTLNELGLMEAKTFVESVPKAVKEDIDKVEAEQIKKQLEEAGGTVDLT